MTFPETVAEMSHVQVVTIQKTDAVHYKQVKNKKFWLTQIDPQLQEHKYSSHMLF